jgi:hypothetical protein
VGARGPAATGRPRARNTNTETPLGGVHVEPIPKHAIRTSQPPLPLSGLRLLLLLLRLLLLLPRRQRVEAQRVCSVAGQIFVATGVVRDMPHWSWIPEAPRGGLRGEARRVPQKRHLPHRGAEPGKRIISRLSTEVRRLVRWRYTGHGLQNTLNLRIYRRPHRAGAAPHQRTCSTPKRLLSRPAEHSTRRATLRGNTPIEFGRVSTWAKRTKSDLALEKEIHGHPPSIVFEIQAPKFIEVQAIDPPDGFEPPGQGRAYIEAPDGTGIFRLRPQRRKEHQQRRPLPIMMLMAV